ncbi:MAG: acyltransferase family protein, partial [Lachnospiraceae bacterium]|nr:acyltransferase family protein [Candidatus Minthocola equi]
MNNRYVWLDIARGICILLMVICHASASGYGRWPEFNGFTGLFFLVFFFAAAGYCFNEDISGKDYIKKQFKKCIVPYLIVSVVYLGVKFFGNAIPGDTLPRQIINAVASLIWGLSNTFTIGPIQTIGMGPIWFLVVFFMSTVLYKLLYKIK